MATSEELMAQSQQLAAAAKEMRKTEIADMVESIKKTIAENGISAEDLGYLPMKVKRVKKEKGGAPAAAEAQLPSAPDAETAAAPNANEPAAQEGEVEGQSGEPETSDSTATE